MGDAGTKMGVEGSRAASPGASIGVVVVEAVTIEVLTIGADDMRTVSVSNVGAGVGGIASVVDLGIVDDAAVGSDAVAGSVTDAGSAAKFLESLLPSAKTTTTTATAKTMRPSADPRTRLLGWWRVAPRTTEDCPL